MVALYVFLYVEVGLENYKQHIPEQYIRFLDTFKKIPLQENSNWNFQRRGVNIPNGQKSMICRCEDFVGFLPGTLSPLVSYSSGYLPFLASVVDFFPGSYRLTHVDFEGWQFISRPTVSTLFTDDIDEQFTLADKSKPIVCFGSFQDLLGVDRTTGTIKAHNEWIHATHWDLVIFDEYHFGAWREKAKELFEKEDDEQEIERLEEEKYDPDSVYDESFLPISTSHYLFLSGTPFRAINSGEFIEEQIFSWTYSDEQRAKEEWDDSQGSNPYAALPRMVMLTYKMPEAIRKIAMQGEFNEFDLNVFFSTVGKKNEARFAFEAYVQKWLDLLRGQYFETSAEDLKTGRRSPFPFSDIRLRQVLNHTLWYMPSVDSCYAMKNLLKQKQNSFYHSYRAVVAAGSEAGQGAEAMIPVERAMEDPLKTQTITLTCGKLTTGVTVKPWTGIFMLRNLKQPESYFQAAFRVQSPWTAGKEIIKEECYVLKLRT